MSAQESRVTFFRQSTWLIVATVANGVLLFGVQAVAQQLPPGEYGVFLSLLRVLLLMGIPAAGLQTVFAQQAAAALTEAQRKELAAATRAIVGVIALVWCGMAIVLGLGQGRWLASLKIVNPAALWFTALAALVFLWLPVVRGLLQGLQNFTGLGWILILDALGRFVAIGLGVALGGQAATAMAGVLAGLLCALIVGGWLTRSVWRRADGAFAWRAWWRRVVPLTVGAAALVFMTGADGVFVQARFAREQTPFYLAAALVGTAMLMFITPLAAVMFPKVVRSLASAERTDALLLALAPTVGLGLATALGCTCLPKLPLQVIFFRTPEYWQSAPLVPWFAWALVPLLLANVLVGNLLARERFAVVPWLALVAAGYGVALGWQAEGWAQLPAMTAFRRVIQTLGAFNVLLLAVALGFTLRRPAPPGSDRTSPPAAGR
jgi:O-antigen/teichoic acid export membrane protein